MNDLSDDSSTENQHEMRTTPGSALPVLVCIVILTLFLILLGTRPSTGGPALVLSVLSLIFVLILSLVYFFIQRWWSRSNDTSVTKRHNLLVSVCLTAGLIIMLGLQTLGQLSLLDIALVVFLELLLLFYITRRF